MAVISTNKAVSLSSPCEGPTCLCTADSGPKGGGAEMTSLLKRGINEGMEAWENTPGEQPLILIDYRLLVKASCGFSTDKRIITLNYI